MSLIGEVVTLFPSLKSRSISFREFNRSFLEKVRRGIGCQRKKKKLIRKKGR
jgi:hypothetical protein